MGNSQRTINIQRDVIDEVNLFPNKELHFNVKISNIRAKGLDKIGSQLKFEFADLPPLLSSIKFSQNPIWADQFEFDYKSSISKLLEQCLKIKLYLNKGEKKIGQIKVMLYEICTGPIHFDYKINKKCRIYFDIHMSQFLNVKIKVLKLVATMCNNLRAPRYFFNFSLIKHKKNIDSALSEPFQNILLNMPIYDVQKTKDVAHIDSPLPKKFYQSTVFNNLKNFQIIPKREFQNQEAENFYHKLHNNQDHTNQVKVEGKNVIAWNSSPELSYELNMQDLSAINFKISLWKDIQTTCPHGSEKVILRGETYFFLQKILNSKENSRQDHKIIKQQSWTKEVYLDGKKQGDITITIQVIHDYYFAQKVAGVMCEDGVILQSPIIYHRKEKDHAQIEQLKRAYKELNQLIFKRQQESDQMKIKQFDKEIKSNLFQTNLLLKKSEKVTQKTFTYKSEEEILVFQNYLINYGELCLTLYKNISEEEEETFFSLMINILSRGELSLQFIMIKQELSSNLKKSKIIMGIQFQRFLYDVLYYVLNDLNQKGLFQNQKNFMVFFLAYSYFAIPEFRQEFLECIDDKEIENNKMETEIEMILFNWNAKFYQKIVIQKEDFEENQIVLAQALKCGWQRKIKNRSLIFFLFLKELMIYIKKALVVTKLDWNSIPGYNRLIEIFIQELNSRSILHIREFALHTGKAILENQALLQPMTMTLITRTNLEDSFQLTVCIKILNAWFAKYEENQRFLPGDLNVHLLLLMTMFIYKSENATTIANTLNFWYKNFSFFPVYFKLLYIEILVKYYFYNFFLHWSINVRNLFSHFLVYTIKYLYSQVDSKHKGHLEKLMTQIENKVNFCCYAAEEYSENYKKWCFLTTRQQRHYTLTEMQRQLVKNIYKNKLSSPKNYISIFNIKQPELLRTVSIMDDQNLVQDIILDIEHTMQKDSKINISKYRELFNNQDIEHSQISPSNITYCQKSVGEFRKILDIYDKQKNTFLSSQTFPNLTLVIPKDNFESEKDIDEFDW